MTAQACEQGGLDRTRDLVTVAIPVLNEERAIDECLQRLRSQTYANIEILVADGGSDDRTRVIVSAHAAMDDRITLVDNVGRIQGAGLNEILTRAHGAIVVRLDARSFVDATYVERVLDVLARTDAAVVGGKMVPRPRPGVVAAGIALANRSAWGAGPARFHTGGGEGPAETVYLGSFVRVWLDRVGGWATDVGVNEDYELNHRIRSAGGVVWFDPSLEVGYEPRADYVALARQYFRYGRSKAAVLRRHPGSARARQVLPSTLGPIGLTALVGRGRLRQATRTLVIGHLGLVALAAYLEDEDPAVRATGAVAAAVMHWSWAVGLGIGFVRPFPAAGAT